MKSLIKKLFKNKSRDRVCFVISSNNKGYILDRIAKEIGKAFENPIFYYTDEKILPKADKYFVTHYSLLGPVFKNSNSAEIFCFFTHNKGHLNDYLKYLKLCKAVIAENQEGLNILLENGLKKEKLYFVPECANPNQFKACKREEDGAILVCGTNYEDDRKNPKLIEQLVAKLPNRKFILLGKKWESFSTYKNVEICDVNYEEYLSVYHRCSVYLSASKLEGGGPNSLIEAMHANLVPVVSDTGNSRDYINSGYNGFVFSCNDSLEYIASLIEKAHEIKVDVFSTVKNFTWDFYASKMRSIILYKKSQLNIFIRSFNAYINSKSGVLLPPGEKRGTPEWEIFEKILTNAIGGLGHNFHLQLETPLEKDIAFWKDVDGQILKPDKRISVHKCKRDLPDYDLFYMQMHMKNLFTINKNGWGADNSDNSLFDPVKIDDDLAKKFCNELSQKILASGGSKCEQPKETDDTPQNFIFVPIQTPRDYVLKHHSPVSVINFINEIIKWAEKSKNHVCFKLHPFNKGDRDIMDAVSLGAEKSEYVHNINGNINELIKRCTGLFLINSGTGFESLIHGKPVVTFGNCDYKQVTFAGDISNFDIAKNFLFEYQEKQRVLAYKFVYWYFNHHAFDVYSPETEGRLRSYLKRVL